MKSPADAVERIRVVARGLVEGRRLVLAGFPVAAASQLVPQLRALGSGRCLVVGPFVGTGDLPDPADADWLSLDIEAAHAIDEFRQFERAVADPPARLVDALRTFDPGREAIVLPVPYQAFIEVAGRPVVGGRRPAWTALEDKTTNDALFDDAGVRRPPNEIVDARDTEGLTRAHRAHAGDHGTVWAGDAREGFNGGAIFLRWVTDEGAAAEAQRYFSAHCDRVRVAPFLDGIPCSIHGFVTADGVAVFRPVEMVTLRAPSPPTLIYAGASTFFDPPASARAAMRVAARRVGELLRARVGFLGSFGLDGVLTDRGFLPTELNPRMGGGLNMVTRSLPEVPLIPFHWATVAGHEVPVTPREIEDAVTQAADAERTGGGWLTVPARWNETNEHPVVVVDGVCTPAAEGATPDGLVMTGPAAGGGFVRFQAEPSRTPVGPPIAETVARVLAWVDDALGAGIGPLEAATPADPPVSSGLEAPPERMETATGATVRRVRPSDAEAFGEAVRANLDHLAPWMPWATPVAAETEVQRERLVAADATWDDRSDHEFAIVIDADGGEEGELGEPGERIIGACGLMRRIGPGAIEIGYWLDQGHTGHGYATAAARALTTAAWGLPDIERVEIHCDESNAASAAVPLRLGYRLDRVEQSEPSAPGESGRNLIWISDRRTAD
jgi:RimJ/RimL family protein N-acetyltransferase